MSPVFCVLAAITLAGALGAMALRKLVHNALSAAISFAGTGLLFIQLGAEFAGLAQILVYVGAIAVLMVFVILLTGSGETGATPGADGMGSEAGTDRKPFTARPAPAPDERKAGPPARGARGWRLGLLVGLVTLVGLLVALMRSSSLARWPREAATLTVKTLGTELMSRYLLPLEVVGLLLTAALIGAAVIALEEKGRP
jgi:NADH-quinone oxidoreductase subunit J